MGDAVKVEGLKLVELFKEMVKKKVIISMHVVGAEIDRLTCITGLMESEEDQCLFIDPPDDFKEAAGNKKRWHLRFNFNGPDHLEHLFSTRCGTLSKQGLKVPFPEYVERLQRRRYFRVDTLTGSEMHFRMKKVQGVIHLINISEDGAYGVLVKHNFKFIRGSVLKMEQHVHDVRMLFPGDEDTPEETIHVKRAEVVRVKHDKERGFYRYAFKFKDLEKKERDRLIQVIYALQRKYLRRRK